MKLHQRLKFMAVWMMLCLAAAMPLRGNAAPLRQQAAQSGIERVRADVARLIQSKDERELAWAAFYIREYKLTEYLPNLLDILKVPQFSKGEPGNAYYLLCGVLDALIQLQADIPPEILFDLFSRYRSAVIYYLAQSPARFEGLMLTLAGQSVSTTHWYALISPLADIKSKSLAAFLLRGISINATIMVLERGRGIGTACGWGSDDDGYFGVPDGFPPTADYHIDISAPEPGVSLYHSVRYLRRVVQPGPENRVGKGGSDMSGRREQYRLEGLAKLLDVQVKDLGVDLKPDYQVTWRGPQTFKQTVQGIRNEIYGQFGRLAARYVERGLLSASEAGTLRPELSLNVSDLRENKSVALPRIKNDEQ